MDIVQEFIKASLKEANRSEVSIAYNTNLSKTERLAIILAKSLNGKILKKDRYSFSLQFNLPQNYNFRVYYSNSSFPGHISLNDKEIFYWKNLYFVKDRDINYLTDEAKNCENKYNVPVDVSLAALKIVSKMLSIEATFNSQNLPDKDVTDKRASTKARRNLEKYKKEQAYYRDLFVKSGAISEEDLTRYIISIEPEECNDPDWDLDDDGGSATFINKIAFIFKNKITKALYKLIYEVKFTAGADGWSTPGSYWEPPDGEEWLTGNVYDDIEAEFWDLETDEPEANEALEDHLADIIDNFANSGMLAQYINDNLEDITGYEVK